MYKPLPIQTQQFIASIDLDHKGQKFGVYCQTRQCVECEKDSRGDAEKKLEKSQREIC